MLHLLRRRFPAWCAQLPHEQWRGARTAVPSKVTLQLLKNVDGLGAAKDIVTVNPGFFRNKLVPCGLALAIQHASGQPASRARAHSADLSPERQQQQFDKLMKTLSTCTLTLKRRTKDDAELQEPVNAQDIAEAVGRQLRIHMDPGLVDLGGESLPVVGEYRIPLKLILGSGDRATLDISISST